MQHSGRPTTMPFVDFMQKGAEGALPDALYTLKCDGFSWRARADPTGVAYFTKQENRIEQIPVEKKPRTILEAIVLFIHEMDPPMLNPSDVRFGTNGTRARELRFEFSAYSLEDETRTDDLQLLFHKQCTNPETGRLDTDRFGYRITIYDARFTEEGEKQMPYYYRLQSIQEHYIEPERRSPIVEISAGIFDAEELLETLLKEEGLVLHLRNGACHKVKLPRFVLKAHLLAVGRNIDNPDFIGYNRFVFGVQSDEDDSQWHVVHVADYGEMMTDFDRPTQGKAFIPPQSIRAGADGLLECKGKFALQGLMHALHQIASRSGRCSIQKLTPRVAVVRGGDTIQVGSNRTFELKACDRFLDPPMPVTLGGSRLWLLSDEKEVHIQPPTIVSIEGYYGHSAYNDMPVTRHGTLLRLARENPNPHRAYLEVGMRTDPFLGLKDDFLRNMQDEYLFRPDAERPRKRARV